MGAHKNEFIMEQRELAENQTLVEHVDVIPHGKLCINVGNVEIIGGDKMPDARGTRILIDGVEQKRVRKLVLTIGVGEPTTLQMEHLVNAAGTATKAASESPECSTGI